MKLMIECLSLLFENLSESPFKVNKVTLIKPDFIDNNVTRIMNICQQ